MSGTFYPSSTHSTIVLVCLCVCVYIYIYIYLIYIYILYIYILNTLLYTLICLDTVGLTDDFIICRSFLYNNMSKELYIFLLLNSLRLVTLNPSKCLGMSTACNLPLDEITLLGAHNAGAGFDGLLMKHINNFPDIPMSLLWRNQRFSIYDQLDHGVRYFDIDLCYEANAEDYDGEHIWTCHGSAYGGKMSDFLGQVDRWIKEPRNRNELVVLNFNRDFEKGTYKQQLGDGIIALLEGLWSPAKTGTNQVKMQENIDATIGTSITDNKRIYVFLRTGLQSHISRGQRKPYFFSESNIGYTWRKRKFDNCRVFADTLSSRCPSEAYRKFVSLDFSQWPAVETADEGITTGCHRYVVYAAQECYRKIQSSGKTNKTVNFVVIDYVNKLTSQEVNDATKGITERRALKEIG